jgi:hypothetical protein
VNFTPEDFESHISLFNKILPVDIESFYGTQPKPATESKSKVETQQASGCSRTHRIKSYCNASRQSGEAEDGKAQGKFDYQSKIHVHQDFISW